MPLYEYECKDCGVRFERMQSFNDAPIKVCPECEGEVHRIIGATGIIFKGSGFYVTDNRRSGEAGKNKAGATDKPAETKTTETKSETKSTTPSTEAASS
jgi:putative FmdB family regulatory protein